jgi:very-short-patch-repair endonuclease
VERTVVVFAKRHHGLVTRERLLAAGFTVAAIKHAQRAGRIREMRPGVYGLVGSPPTWMQGLAAVLLSVDGAVATHSSAARLYDLRSSHARYEITTARIRRVRLPGVDEHRSLCWLPEDTRLRVGMKVSSPARLVVDLSGRLDRKALGSMTDELVRRRLLRLGDLARTAGRLAPAPRRRTRLVHDVLAARWHGYAPGDSDLEARVIRALHRAGLPAPTAQHRVQIGGRRYRVDLCYPDVRLAIEIDSWAYHQWRSAFDGDRARRNDLTLNGFHVLQVTDGMTDGEIVDIIGSGLSRLGRLGA